MMTSKTSSHSLYSLSIQVRLDGLSFFTQKSASNEIVEYGEVCFRESVTLLTVVPEIEKAFNEKEILKQSFNKVTVIYANELFTIVPIALFDATKAADYLKFNTKILSTDFVAHDIIEEHELVNVYVPYSNVNNYFFERYGSFDFYHSTTIFVKNVLNHSKSKTDNEVNVHLSPTHFYLSIIKNKKLELINRFEIRTPEDFIYYLLFTCEQLEINPDSTLVKISGSIKKNDPYYEMAYTYIRHLEIIDSENNAIPKENYLLASLL